MCRRGGMTNHTPTRRTKLRTGWLGLLVAVSGTWLATSPGAQSRYETLPVLRAGDLAPAELLQGPRHRVDEHVPTDGLLARFTVRSDFGTFLVAGPGMLPIRIGEIAALAQLEKVTQEEVFKQSLAKAAERTGRSLQAAVQDPVETVKGLPEGVGRFFERVGRAAKTGGQKAGDYLEQQQGKAGGASAGETAAVAGTATARVAGEVFGYYDARRRIAKALRVDPYTTNPVLDKKLDEVAWAAFAGEFGLDRAVGLVPGVSWAVWASDLVWDKSPGDLNVMVDKKLRAMGVTQAAVDGFLRHRWFTLTTRVAFVEGLDALASATGRAQVIPLALSAESEEQARFVVGAVAILARHHAAVAPIAEVRVAGLVLGRTRSGALVVPAPVDYVAWTERVATFARRADLKAAERGVWLGGQVSPRTRQELQTLGWRVHERFLPEAMSAGLR